MFRNCFRSHGVRQPQFDIHHLPILENATSVLSRKSELFFKTKNILSLQRKFHAKLLLLKCGILSIKQHNSDDIHKKRRVSTNTRCRGYRWCLFA